MNNSNKTNPVKNITNNFTMLITNIKNNNHALINYDASVRDFVHSIYFNIIFG